MGAAHGHRLHFHGHSPIHRLPAQCKLLALVSFVLVVVATPTGVFWPYAAYAVALLIAAVVAEVPLRFLGVRMVVELPFVVFAVLMMFIAQGPRVEVAGISFSQHGLVAGAALLCKGTLGVAASLLVAATTEPRDVLAGLQRLRMPEQLVQIMSFMIRYLDVATDEMRRMRIARQARCFAETGPRSWPVLARSAGALFIRSYERGERVHLAMLARGYQGRLPALGAAAATAGEWATAALLPAIAVAACAAAWLAGG